MIYVLGYRGISTISRLIRFQTRSCYSHVSVEIDGVNYEAWHKGGVIKRNWAQGHTPGTKVDVFSVSWCRVVSKDILVQCLENELGKRYDFRGVFRFLTRHEHELDEKWFCSELVSWAFMQAGVSIQNLSPSKISPRDVCMSPVLHKIRKRKIDKG